MSENIRIDKNIAQHYDEADVEKVKHLIAHTLTDRQIQSEEKYKQVKGKMGIFDHVLDANRWAFHIGTNTNEVEESIDKQGLIINELDAARINKDDKEFEKKYKQLFGKNFNMSDFDEYLKADKKYREENNIPKNHILLGDKAFEKASEKVLESYQDLPKEKIESLQNWNAGSEMGAKLIAELYTASGTKGKNLFSKAGKTGGKAGITSFVYDLINKGTSENVLTGKESLDWEKIKESGKDAIKTTAFFGGAELLSLALPFIGKGAKAGAEKILPNAVSKIGSKTAATSAVLATEVGAFTGIDYGTSKAMGDDVSLKDCAKGNATFIGAMKTATGGLGFLARTAPGLVKAAKAIFGNGKNKLSLHDLSTEAAVTDAKAAVKGAKVESPKAEVKPTEAEIQKIKEKEHFKEVFDGIERDNREAAIDFQDRLRIFKRNRKPVEPVKAETKAETKPIEVKNTEVKPIEIIEPKAETPYAEAAVTDAKAVVESAKPTAPVGKVKAPISNEKVGRVVILPDGTKVVDKSPNQINSIKPGLFRKLIGKFIKFLDTTSSKTLKCRINKPFPIQFKPAESILELKNFARENLGVKISASKKCSPEKLEQYNEIIRIFVDIHNKSHGEIKLPTSIKIKDLGICADGETKFTSIAFNEYGTGAWLEHVIYHELGHLNHIINEPFCYRNMGTLSQVESLGTNTEIIKEFKTNISLQKMIERYIGTYACESPAEFVAEVFSGLLQGKTFPKEIMDRYRMYKGPTGYKTFLYNTP